MCISVSHLCAPVFGALSSSLSLFLSVCLCRLSLSLPLSLSLFPPVSLLFLPKHCYVFRLVWRYKTQIPSTFCSSKANQSVPFDTTSASPPVLLAIMTTGWEGAEAHSHLLLRPTRRHPRDGDRRALCHLPAAALHTQPEGSHDRSNPGPHR